MIVYEAIRTAPKQRSHSIGMRVTVEGIEKPEQFAMFRKLGADEVQGFLMGRPTPDPASKIGLVLNHEGLAVTADSAGCAPAELVVGSTINEMPRRPNRDRRA
jgi:predicted signal transduction protein with EAL and GGDEF domain